MSLEQELNQFKSQFLNQVDDETQSIMAEATAELSASDIEKLAVQVGSQLLEFTLPDQHGNQVTLSTLLQSGPLVVSFYRGGWCPYCNLELGALQKVLPEIEELGAQLVAITPELPDESMSTTEKNALQFKILTDQGASYARQLGLVFTLPEKLRPIYEAFGINIEKHNGSGQFDLPLAATYVVGQDGKIVSAYIDADYTKRQEPQEILSALKALQSEVVN
ncbi:redoxin superfamily protein [Oleiphilus messinensis]|uniref:thioredoxin-dependent peroxiredoxin n=1 Tax=Oleiphilus messinensis TaxID=141451 RepID=A0A1Y0I7B8_9GAMM|nr:peroxiredoxin-like family protein [Oleiphilus messinensis]ARU55405.1 redoxin superfamily protein [Oleiphilus messinensis]